MWGQNAHSSPQGSPSSRVPPPGPQGPNWVVNQVAPGVPPSVRQPQPAARPPTGFPSPPNQPLTTMAQMMASMPRPGPGMPQQHMVRGLSPQRSGNPKPHAQLPPVSLFPQVMTSPPKTGPNPVPGHFLESMAGFLGHNQGAPMPPSRTPSATAGQVDPRPPNPVAGVNKNQVTPPKGVAESTEGTTPPPPNPIPGDQEGRSIPSSAARPSTKGESCSNDFPMGVAAEVSVPWTPQVGEGFTLTAPLPELESELGAGYKTLRQIDETFLEGKVQDDGQIPTTTTSVDATQEKTSSDLRKVRKRGRPKTDREPSKDSPFVVIYDHDIQSANEASLLEETKKVKRQITKTYKAK